MAKNSVRDYSATNSSNTDIQSIDISEGCSPAGINNAVREIMVDLKNVSTGAVALETPSADQLNVDNLRLDGNTISSTDTNGDITIDPDGTGVVDVVGTLQSDGLTVDGDVTLNDGSPNLRLKDTDTNRFVDLLYGTRVATIRNTMAAGEDIDTVEPSMVFSFKDDGETRTAMTIDHDGQVGIGNSAPASSLDVASDGANFVARFTNDGNNANRLGIFVQTGTDDGSGTNVFFAAYDGNGDETGQLRSVSGTFQLTDTSDERLKQDIVDTTVSGLTSVNAMRVRDFAYKRNPTQTIKAGFVAQELQTAFSHAVSYSEADDDKILSVSRERLVPVLVKAIQELSAKNDALEARITALEAV